jgi:hypothetical protein
MEGKLKWKKVLTFFSIYAENELSPLPEKTKRIVAKWKSFNAKTYI